MAKQKTDLQVFQEWVQELTGFVFGTEEKPKKSKTFGGEARILLSKIHFG